MRSFLPLSLYCISLFYLQVHAFPVGNRLDFMTRLYQMRGGSFVMSQSELSNGLSTEPVVLLDKTVLWRVLLFKYPPASFEETLSTFDVPQTTQPIRGASVWQREKPNQGRSRGRRHAQFRSKSLGCILSTCQVHKTSQNIYQMVIQKKLKDLAPIDVRSPYSYG